MSIFPPLNNRNPLEPLALPPISAKPWFVIATKADKDAAVTQTEFQRLAAYVAQIERGQVPHPSGKQNGWRTRIAAIPVSAIHGQGIDKIVRFTAGVLDSLMVGM